MYQHVTKKTHLVMVLKSPLYTNSRKKALIQNAPSINIKEMSLCYKHFETHYS